MPKPLDHQLDTVLVALVGVELDRYDPVVVLDAVERAGDVVDTETEALVRRLDCLLAAGADGFEVVRVG